MKLAKAALNRARAILAQNAIEDAPLEAELLLRHTLKIDRTQLYLDLEKELSPEDEKAFGRSGRTPPERRAYRLYHRPPRILRAGILCQPPHPYPPPRKRAAGGNGSKAGAEPAHLYYSRHRHRLRRHCHQPGAGHCRKPESTPPTSPLAALEVATINCQRHSVADRVHLLQGDMLEPLPEPVDLIIANLPYVRQSELTPDNFEPLLALDGGAEGTESIARLCRQAKSKLADGGSMLLEIGAGQGETITGLLKSLFPDGAVEVFRGFKRHRAGDILEPQPGKGGKIMEAGSVSAILLAAGRSSRMGKLKQLMPLGDSTILEQTLDNLLGSTPNRGHRGAGLQSRRDNEENIGQAHQGGGKPALPKGDEHLHRRGAEIRR